MFIKTLKINFYASNFLLEMHKCLQPILHNNFVEDTKF